MIDMFKNLITNRNIERCKIVFMSGLVFSVLNHIMVLTNKFSFHDDIGSIFATGAGIDMGRWFLSVIKHAIISLCGSVYSMPFYCGFIGLLSITIFCLILFELFEIYNKYFIILITGICISIPTVSSFLGYTFVVASYFFMYMLSALSVLLICRYRNIAVWTISVFVFVCSIGTYQGVIPIIICMINIYIIKMFKDDKYSTFKEFIRDILYYFFTLLFVLIVYLIFSYLFLKISNKTLTSYRSMDSATTISIILYLKRFLVVYKEYFVPTNLIKSGLFPYFTIVFYYLFVVVSILNSIILIATINVNNNIILKICCIFTMLLLPISINFIHIMVEDNINVLMLYQIIFIFVYCFTIYSFNNKFYIKAFNYLSLFCLSIFILLLIRYNNSCYLKAEMAQTQIINYYNNIVSRIQSIKGYDNHMKICFYSDKYPDIHDDSYAKIPQFDLIITPPYNNISINTYTYKSVLKMWCGFEPEYVEPESYDNNDFVQSMPVYPNDGSVAVLGEVIVVKLK